MKGSVLRFVGGVRYRKPVLTVRFTRMWYFQLGEAVSNTTCRDRDQP
jgi:hypothetical protein